MYHIQFKHNIVSPQGMFCLLAIYLNAYNACSSPLTNNLFNPRCVNACSCWNCNSRMETAPKIAPALLFIFVTCYEAFIRRTRTIRVWNWPLNSLYLTYVLTERPQYSERKAIMWPSWTDMSGNTPDMLKWSAT